MIRNEKTSIVVLAQRDSQLEHMMKMLQTTSEAELGKNIIIENDPGAVYDHLLCTTTVQMLFFETKGVEFPTGPRKFDRKHALFAVARDARIPIVALAEQWQTKPLDTTMRDLPDPHALVQKNTIDALLEYGTDEQSVQTLQHNMLTLITARAALQAPSPRHAFTAPVIDIISGGPFAGKTVNDNILFDNYTIDRYNILPIMRIKTTSRETVKESPRTHRIDAKTYATWLEKGEIICPYDIGERRYGSLAPNMHQSNHWMYVARLQGVIDAKKGAERMVTWALQNNIQPRVFFLDVDREELELRTKGVVMSAQFIERYIEADSAQKHRHGQLRAIRELLPEGAVHIIQTSAKDSQLAQSFENQPPAVTAMNTALDVARIINRKMLEPPTYLR